MGRATFHRTFLDVTHLSRLESGWSEYRRVALRGSIKGYVFANGFHPLDLFPKPNQDFASYATDWERACSKLIRGAWGTTLSPLVGSNTHLGHPVVGHYGTVPSNRIIVQKVTKPDLRQLAAYIQEGGGAYVTNLDYPDAGSWTKMDNNGYYRYVVVTDPVGAIAMILEGNLRDESIESVDPLLYASIGYSMVALGASVGSSLIRTIVRKHAEVRAGQALLKSLKERLAEKPPPQKALPPGSPPPKALPPGPPVPRRPPQDFINVMEPLTDEILAKLPNGRVARLVRNRNTIGREGSPRPGQQGYVAPAPNAELPSINQAIDLIKDARELARARLLSQGATNLIANELYPILRRMRPNIGGEIGQRFMPAKPAR